MPRTKQQDKRRKELAFAMQCRKWKTGDRKSPPRLYWAEGGNVVAQWRAIASTQGIDPDDVYNEADHIGEAQKEAALMHCTIKEAFALLWEEYASPIRARRKAEASVKQVVRMRERGDVLEHREMVNAAPEGSPEADTELRKYMKEFGYTDEQIDKNIEEKREKLLPKIRSKGDITKENLRAAVKKASANTC